MKKSNLFGCFVVAFLSGNEGEGGLILEVLWEKVTMYRLPPWARTGWVELLHQQYISGLNYHLFSYDDLRKAHPFPKARDASMAK
jgi:hypothetical protein